MAIGIHLFVLIRQIVACNHVVTAALERQKWGPCAVSESGLITYAKPNTCLTHLTTSTRSSIPHTWGVSGLSLKASRLAQLSNSLRRDALSALRAPPILEALLCPSPVRTFGSLTISRLYRQCRRRDHLPRAVRT